MPALFIFDKRHSFALFGSRQDGRGLTLDPFGFFEGLQDFFEFVSVDDDRMPTKAAEFFLVGFNVGSVHGFLTLSQAVSIDDADQIIQLVVSGQRCRFPNSTLSAFTIPHQHESPIVHLIQKLGIEGHSRSD